MPKPIHRAEYEAVRYLIRKLRQEAGLKQVDVAAALDQSQPYISAIETGDRRLDIVELGDLCDVLGVTLRGFVQRLEAVLRKPKASRKPSRRRVD